jgi:hypothetical protein
MSGVEQVRVSGETDSERPSAYVVAHARLGIDRTRTLYYCVQFDQDTIWVFSRAAALGRAVGESGRDTTAKLGRGFDIPADFTRLTGTLRVFYDPLVAREMAVALQRGKDYLGRYQLQADTGKLRVDESIRHYEVRVAGESVGFLTRRFTRENEPLQRPGQVSNAKEGLRVREHSCRFAADGTAYFGKVDLFSSRDTETDLCEFWQARVPPRDGGDPATLITRDQCVREANALFSTHAPSRDEVLPEPRRPLKLDASYLGLAWARLLPALLGPEPRPTHAFTIYDSETRTLITHAITPLGEKPLPGRPDQPAYAFETRAGFVETPGTVYTDAHGNVLRFEAGNLVLQLSDAGTIEKKFGRRRDAANARLQNRP